MFFRNWKITSGSQIEKSHPYPGICTHWLKGVHVHPARTPVTAIYWMVFGTDVIVVGGGCKQVLFDYLQCSWACENGWNHSRTQINLVAKCERGIGVSRHLFSFLASVLLQHPPVAARSTCNFFIIKIRSKVATQTKRDKHSYRGCDSPSFPIYSLFPLSQLCLWCLTFFYCSISSVVITDQ